MARIRSYHAGGVGRTRNSSTSDHAASGFRYAIVENAQDNMSAGGAWRRCVRMLRLRPATAGDIRPRGSRGARAANLAEHCQPEEQQNLPAHDRQRSASQWTVSAPAAVFEDIHASPYMLDPPPPSAMCSASYYRTSSRADQPVRQTVNPPAAMSLLAPGATVACQLRCPRAKKNKAAPIVYHSDMRRSTVQQSEHTSGLASRSPAVLYCTYDPRTAHLRP